MERIPTIFISYSWTSEEYKEDVLKIAEDLTKNHVEVILDQWDLDAGQDRYEFMEKSIEKADKVLILCDSGYVAKADDRTGGVGAETSIITPDVFDDPNQTKFIPVIMEDFKIMPKYLRARMGVDLRKSNYDNGFSEILRIIYSKPRVTKPPLGDYPKWLDGPNNDFEISDGIGNGLTAVEKSEDNSFLSDIVTDDERIVLFYILLNETCNISETDVETWLLNEEIHNVNVRNGFRLLADISLGKYEEHQLEFGMKSFRAIMKDKDRLLNQLSIIIETHRRVSKDIFDELWKNKIFNDAEKVFSAYLSEKHVTCLGDRWMADQQIRDIADWEKKHLLKPIVSNSYQELLKLFIDNGLLYPSGWTSYGNPREFSLHKSLRLYLHSSKFKDDHKKELSEIGIRLLYF